MSCHHPTHFKAMVQGEIKRLRLINRIDKDYELAKRNFYERLIERDYSSTSLDMWFTIKPLRSAMLRVHKENQKLDRSPFVISTIFTTSWRHFAKDAIRETDGIPELELFDTMIGWRIGPQLQYLFK